MGKFSELFCVVKQIAKRHTRMVLSRKAQAKEEKAILEKWSYLAMRLVKKAKTTTELKKAKQYAPSGSEAETLADSRLDEAKRHPWGRRRPAGGSPDGSES